MFFFRVVVLLCVAAFFATESPCASPLPALSAVEGLPTLSFDELVTLAAVDLVPAPLEAKLQRLFSTPFLSNEAAARGVAPNSPVVPGIGPVLRIAEWNIYRSPREHEVELALADPNGYLSAARTNSNLQPKDLPKLENQLQDLAGADIIVLNEVDDGVNRNGYVNVPRSLAERLNMNYVYAVEFIELNRIYLGVKKMDTAESSKARPGETFGLDPKRYLGLEGTALLSRYPIRSARIIRLPQTYDWYHGEINAVSELERARAWTSEKLFEERIARQIRRGGRLAIIAELDVPQSPAGVLTVVCPHLEDYTGAKGRREQMGYVLSHIGDIANPAIVVGDLNTMGHNARPINVRYEVLHYLKNYRFWARQALFFFLPVPGLSYAFRAANYFKNYRDPTAFSIPLLLPNPSRKLFQDVRHFRFADGSALDFSGNRAASYGHRGSTLADSSQRAWKGFTPTFTFNRTYNGLVGEYKLDWAFVKCRQRA